MAVRRGIYICPCSVVIYGFLSYYGFCQSLGLVSQCCCVSISIAVTEHYAHASVHVLFLLSEDAQACIVLFQHVEHVVFGFVVCLLLCQDDGACACMLKMYGRNRQSHYGTEVQFKLVEVECVSERYHACVVRTG